MNGKITYGANSQLMVLSKDSFQGKNVVTKHEKIHIYTLSKVDPANLWTNCNITEIVKDKMDRIFKRITSHRK